jgi:hypothetical protein
VKLPSFRRIFTQDFSEDYKDLIEKLSTTLNNGIEILYNLGNKNITLSDNISCTVKDIQLIVDSSGTPKNTTSFILDETVKTRQVIGVTVLDVQNLTNSANLPSSQPFVSWTQSSGNVIINKIKGLPAGDNFRIRLVAYN